MIETISLKDYINADGGLPYARGMSSFSEPTLLTILACFAENRLAEAQPLIDWTLKTINPDGSIGLNREFKQEGLWNTSLLAMVMHHLGRVTERDAAVEFLLRFRSLPAARTSANDIDSTLIGWPWLPATFGWVEPTAWALMALRWAGKEQHPRAIEGRKLIMDRCMNDGGWDYGNKVVFGKALIPFWDSTAIALLALPGEDKALIEKSVHLLESSISEIFSLYSLSLVCLALARLGKHVETLRRQIAVLLAQPPGEDLNLAHHAFGILALAQKRVLTP